MSAYVLDTSALLTLRDDEPGADRVAELLTAATSGRVHCYASFMTRMELLYRVWKDEGETEGRLALEQCDSLPIEWVGESDELLQRAAAIKATHTVSVADAWIAACAAIKNAILVHKDPEFAPVRISQETLPMRSKRRGPRSKG